MGEPPRVRSSFLVPHSTWVRLPDDGFEVMHEGAGVQSIGAMSMEVRIRRLGPAITMEGPDAPPPAPASVSLDAIRGPGCPSCELTDRLNRAADLAEEAGDTKTSDALTQLVVRVARRDHLGTGLLVALLGEPR